MDELEFYDGAWTGRQIDAGIGLTGTLANALAVVIDGNKAAVSAAVGQYVLVKNSTITSISDGLYTAAQAIPAATAIDATYLTAVSKGGLNQLKTDLDNKLPRILTKEILAGGTAEIRIGGAYTSFFGLLFTKSGYVNFMPGDGLWLLMGIGNSGSVDNSKRKTTFLGGATNVTVTVEASSAGWTVTNSTSAGVRISLYCPFDAGNMPVSIQ